MSATAVLHDNLLLGTVAYLSRESHLGRLTAVIAPEFGNVAAFCLEESETFPILHQDIFGIAAGTFAGCFRVFPSGIRLALREDGKRRPRVFRFRGKEYDLGPVTIPEGDAALVNGMMRSTPWHYNDPCTIRGMPIFSMWYNHGPGSRYFECYPFPCRIYQTHMLTENGLALELGVRNEGDTPMPFADGLHPRFTALSGKDTRITIPAGLLSESHDKLATGRTMPVSWTPFNLLPPGKPLSYFDGDVDHFFTGLIAGRPVRVEHPTKCLVLDIYYPKEYGYAVLFLPPHRQFLSAELIMGQPGGDLSDAEAADPRARRLANYRVLEPNEVYAGTTEWRLSSWR